MKRHLKQDNLLTFFAVYTCCDAKQLVDKEHLEKYNEITCAECGEPKMFRGSNGLWYSSAGRIFR